MLKQKKLLLLLSIFLIFLSLGCQSTSEKHVEQANEQMNIGTTLGMQDETAMTQYNATYNISANTIFSPKLYIHNRDIKNNDFRLIFLLDYKQINITYNNQNVNYIDISMKPNEQKNIAIEVPSLKNGFHDFLVLCIRKPDTLLSQEKFYPPGHFHIFKRSTLIVGNDNTKPNINFKERLVTNGEIDIPPFVTKEPRDKFEGDVVTLLKQPYPETLWLNFSPIKNNMKYAVIAFSGANQIELDNAFFKTTSTGVINYPLKLGLDKNNKNLIIAVVENPFSELENNSGEISAEPLWVSFLNRISLE